MRLSTVIVSLLFLSSLVVLLFALSGHAHQNVNHIRHHNKPHPKRRNPIRDRNVQKPGLCPQNYLLNGTRTPFKFYRYHNKSRECFLIDEQGPCGRNMIFYRIGNSDFGECDCAHNKRCGRPLLYWEPTDSCYYVNTQGPCKPGQWLVYGLTQKPICKRNFCQPQESNSPSNHRARKFWLAVNNQCIKTRTLGYCPDPQQVMFFKQGEAYPTCVYPTDAQVCTPKYKISRPCWAGQKYDSAEDCRSKVGLWGNEDDH